MTENFFKNFTNGKTTKFHCTNFFNTYLIWAWIMDQEVYSNTAYYLVIQMAVS